MVSQGVLVKLDAKPGLDAEVEEFLASLLPLVRAESETTSWFAIRFGRSEYGIFGAFPDGDARRAHLEGIAADSLRKAEALFEGVPLFRNCVIITNKFPQRETMEDDTKGLYFGFTVKEGHEADVEELLLAAAPLVRDEERTTAWFALRFEDREYGIFVTFPDNAGRLAHLTGLAPREFAKHPLTLLGAINDLHLVNVLVEKLPMDHGMHWKLDFHRNVT